MKIDLSHHGLIGFQKEWRKIQGVKGNLLDHFVDNALAAGHDAVAITSEEKEIPAGSVHDRFGVLLGEANGSERYRVDDAFGGQYVIRIVENDLPRLTNDSSSGQYISRLQDGNRSVYLIDSQSVQSVHNGNLVKSLVLGASGIANGQELDKTLEDLAELKGHRSEVICIAEPFVGRFEYSDLLDIAESGVYDALVTHDAQNVVPSVFGWVPVIGKYNKGVNSLMRDIAKDVDKPGVAITNGHNFTGNNTGIIVDDALIERSDEYSFMRSLGQAIRKGCFQRDESYESFGSWAKDAMKFKLGTRGGRHENYS